MTADVSATFYPDGPLVLRGDVEFVDADGASVDVGRERGLPVALCRCGKSARKPLCDGSHLRIARRAVAAAD